MRLPDYGYRLYLHKSGVYMKVKDIMNSNVVVCHPDTTISAVSQLLKSHKISGMPVTENEKVVGIISEGDILKLLEIPKHDSGLWLPSPFEIIEIPIRELINWEETKGMLENIGSKPIKEIMKTNVHVISPENDIEEAIRMLSKNNINRLPVVQNDKLIGIITRGDILQGLDQDA